MMFADLAYMCRELRLTILDQFVARWLTRLLNIEGGLTLTPGDSGAKDHD